MKASRRFTAAKISASKRNRTKSPGPKSVQVNFSPRQNSIRHGIFAPETLLPVKAKKNGKRFAMECSAVYCPVGSREYRRLERVHGMNRGREDCSVRLPFNAR
jgi:hypothetical protein